MRKFLFIILICPFFAHAQGWLWAQASAGTESQGATSSATDRFGNTYMAGYSGKNLSTDPANSISFGALDIISTDFYYNYLVKYNSSGTPVWLKKIPAYGGNLYVATDRAGNVFLAGSFSGSFTLGAYTITSADTISTNVYLARLDSSGTILWLTGSAGSGGAGGTPSALATDDAGNAMVGGTVSDSVSFGALKLTAHDLFIAKYNADGSINWATSVGGHPQADSIDMGILFPDFIMSMATDHKGNIVVTGNYAADTFTAGTYPLVNRSAGGTNSFLIKYDSTGTVLWANTAGGETSAAGPVSDCAYSTATDSSGSIYIAGVTNSDTLYIGGNAIANACSCYGMLFAKYNSAGTFEWVKPSVFPGGSPATNGSFGLGLAACNCSSMYMIGQALDTVSFGADTLPPAYYIVQFDTAGTSFSAASAGDPNYFLARTVTTDTGGNAYVAGTFYGDCSLGDNNLTLTGGSNAFLAKYGLGATSAVNKVTAATKFTISPNPATNELDISTASNTTSIIIYNMLGQTMYTNTCTTSETKVDISGLAPGTYLVKIDGSAVRKFVKR